MLDSFPDHADLRTPEKMGITFRHLLTMSSGLAWDESTIDTKNSWWQLVNSRDPVRYVLEQPLASPPGAAFTYSSGATTVLARALTSSTGRTLDELARTRLFEPLGISDFEWAPLRVTGEAAAASGLRLRPRDTAKLGQLMLKDGLWGERRLLPPGWAAESMQARLKTSGAYRYGYQWWEGETNVEGGSIRWTAGFGFGGQQLYIVPTLDLVIVVNAGLYGGPYGSLQDRIPKEILAQVIRGATPR